MDCSVTPTVDAAWVIVTDSGVKPVTATVIVAILISFVELVAKFAIIVALPLPEELTVHHVALLDTVQVVFDITSNVVVPDEAVTF